MNVILERTKTKDVFIFPSNKIIADSHSIDFSPTYEKDKKFILKLTLFVDNVFTKGKEQTKKEYEKEKTEMLK